MIDAWFKKFKVNIYIYKEKFYWKEVDNDMTRKVWENHRAIW